MTEKNIREMLRLAGMDIPSALKRTGTGRRAMLYKVAQEATRSVVLGLHIDMQFTLALSLAHFLLRASGKSRAADDPIELHEKLTTFLIRRLGFTSLGELAVWLGIASADHLRVIVDLNELRNKYAHTESPSDRDGSVLRYRGKQLVEPGNLRRLKDDVEEVSSKLLEELSVGLESDDAEADGKGYRYKVTAFTIPPPEW